MKMHDISLSGYENTRLVRYQDPIDAQPIPAIPFSKLGETDVPGVIKACYYRDGELVQQYSPQENHVGVIAATRLGKTTSFVIPTVLSFAKKQKKRSMIISDPKGELYRSTAATLEKEGYRVLLLNFRDFHHSEYWNPLTPIYRKYQEAMDISQKVDIVDVPNEGLRYVFEGKIYESQTELDHDVEQYGIMLVEEVGEKIDAMAQMIITTYKMDDPYWEDCARDVLKAFIWAMLEDSRPETCLKGQTPITEETFSFSTILSILGHFRDKGTDGYEDYGYFSSRNEESRSYLLVKNVLLENAPNTRRCITSSFNSKIALFRDCAMRMTTRCNSFDMETVLTGGPVAIFIDYRDENRAHYQVISLFVQQAYVCLIEHAQEQKNGKLDVPFYFLLDEFGNFPAMTNFETVISACAGRNIFFVLIIQSYAQLNAVYGQAVAEIIRDNLNVHVFFGSNNPKTLEEFSTECGLHTRISPTSALEGSGADIEHYRMETIPLIPKSMLSHLDPGECIVTEANCGYVMWSRLERYFRCPEFKEEESKDDREYKSEISTLDKKYEYRFQRVRTRRNPWD